MDLLNEVVSIGRYDPTGMRKEVRDSEIHYKYTRNASEYRVVHTKANCNRLRQNSSITNNKEQILDSGRNNSRVRGDLVPKSKVVGTSRGWSTRYYIQEIAYRSRY